MPKWLNNVLDYGVDEETFWQLSFAELERLLESRKRTQRAQERQKASYDYILADLIGRSIARVYSSSNEMPKISQVYPTLFTEEEVTEKEQEKKNELSALRFKQFAAAFNNSKKVVGNE